MNFICFSFLLLLSLLNYVDSSAGDYDPNYRTCIRDCLKTCTHGIMHSNVTINAMNSKTNYYIPLYQIIYLDCTDICKYGCIDIITNIRNDLNQPMNKYYGHWPFKRYFGMEEPASSLFSLINTFPHLQYIVQYFLNFKILHGKHKYYMSNWIFLYAISSTIAFTCSTLYHSKKTEFYTLLDLISALFFIITGLFIVIRRTLLTYYSNVYVIIMSFSILYGFFVYRAYNMILKNISFDNHMQLSIILVIITTILWILWIFLFNIKYEVSQKYSNIKYICLFCQIWFILSSLLEIYDFPPIFEIFDAHSLWYYI